VIPFYIKKLSPAQSGKHAHEVVIITLVTLQSYGTDAKPAVPAIAPLLKDADSRVRDSAASAIKQIDPAYAAKAEKK